MFTSVMRGLVYREVLLGNVRVMEAGAVVRLPVRDVRNHSIVQVIVWLNYVYKWYNIIIVSHLQLHTVMF